MAGGKGPNTRATVGGGRKTLSRAEMTPKNVVKATLGNQMPGPQPKAVWSNRKGTRT